MIFFLICLLKLLTWFLNAVVISCGSKFSVSCPMTLITLPHGVTSTSMGLSLVVVLLVLVISFSLSVILFVISKVLHGSIESNVLKEH